VAPPTVLEPPPRAAAPALPALRELQPAPAWPLERPEPPARRDRRRGGALALGLQGTVLALFTYVLVFNCSVVRGSSMAPGIHDGDRILIDHMGYLFHPMERGDVVVLKYPFDPSIDYIKRVIGLPGDEVVLEDGHVWVNGSEVLEPYVAQFDPFTSMTARVLPAHVFVLGDNRPRSSDSREFGQVPRDYVRGKVELRVWPPDRFGRVE
jgi:signal peptidase I